MPVFVRHLCPLLHDSPLLAPPPQPSRPELTSQLQCPPISPPLPLQMSVEGGGLDAHGSPSRSSAAAPEEAGQQPDSGPSHALSATDSAAYVQEDHDQGGNGHAGPTTTTTTTPTHTPTAGPLAVPAAAAPHALTQQQFVGPFVAPSSYLRPHPRSASRPTSAAAAASPMNPLDKEQIEGLVSLGIQFCDPHKHIIVLGSGKLV